MAVPGLERHRLALLAAKEDVGNPRAGTNWAVFAYEKHHDLKLLDSGAGGPDELAGKFSPTSIMYGLCRIPVPGAHRIVLIHWVGEKAPDSQREACAGHLPTIRAFFKEASVVLSARRAEEVTQEGLSRALAQMAPPAGPPSLARRGPPPDTQELVGTNYRKTNPALEIRRTKRDSFWAQAEREEQQRREEERQRAREQRERWERERLAEERRGAAERERRCREKEREIEEQRKEQARLEAEERRKEKARWEQQQREHEEAMRERGRRSESIEKAAEAAVLVSQRSQNPRDFFRQRERSGSTSGTPLPVSPLGTRPGARRPFLRYQRSLTESAFIFRRPDPPPSPGPLHPGAFRAVPPPSPPRPQPALPTSPTGGDTPPCATLGSPSSPVGTGTSPCATLGSPSSPIGTGTPPCATKGSPPSPIGTGTPPCATTRTPPSPMGTGTLPCSTLGSPPSPMGTEIPPCATLGSPPSPMGTEVPPCATLGSPSSPARAGPPYATSPKGTGSPTPCATWRPPSPGGTGVVSPYPMPGPGPLPLPSVPRSGSPDGTCGAEPLPLPSPPGTPQDEDGPPQDSFPLPSPPAWGSPGLLVGADEGVLSPWGGSPLPGLVPAPMPQAGTPPHSPPRLLQDSACPPLPSRELQPGPGGQLEPAQGDSGHNGIGGHEQGGWPDPWDPPPGQGDESSDSILLPQPLHKATPGFALLLARAPPAPQLPGDPSPPAEDEDLSPHAM